MWFAQVPSREVDKDSKKFWTHWNRETKQVVNCRSDIKRCIYIYIYIYIYTHTDVIIDRLPILSLNSRLTSKWP